MNPVRHAVRVGLRRGRTEFALSLRSGQDQGFYLVVGLGVLVYLWFNRGSTVAGTDLLYTTVALPGILAGFVVFGAVLGPAFALAIEREDGTLLRARATPYGLVGYVSGQVVYHTASILPLLLVILVPSALLLDDALPSDPGRWLLLALLLALGLLAALPVGLVIGALVPSTQRVMTWGMLPVVVLFALSGVFFPVQDLWGWLQGVAQVFPMYWLGLGMRAALLPDAAAALELTGSWRTGQAVAVLGAWVLAGLCAVPPVLRRMAGRQSATAVEAARRRAAQVVR